MAKAVIAGASGLVGSKLLNILLQNNDYQLVTALVRKELPVANAKLKQVLTDFSSLDKVAGEITGDVLFCCLGSTRKKTPDLAVYRRIDHDYPLQLAQIALKNGVQQCHLISSMGANASSSNFYTKLKGEIEEDMQKVGMPCLHIYRPSQITGDRKENRPLERVFIATMSVLNPLLVGRLRNFRSIPAETIARAMYKQSLIKQEGVFIHLSNQIKELS